MSKLYKNGVTVLVFAAKYRRVVYDNATGETLRNVYLELGKRYPLKLLEIGSGKDHVFFLMQSVLSYNVTILAGELCGNSYFSSTVGRHGDVYKIKNYVKSKLHEDMKLALL